VGRRPAREAVRGQPRRARRGPTDAASPPWQSQAFLQPSDVSAPGEDCPGLVGNAGLHVVSTASPWHLQARSAMRWDCEGRPIPEPLRRPPWTPSPEGRPPRALDADRVPEEVLSLAGGHALAGRSLRPAVLVDQHAGRRAHAIPRCEPGARQRPPTAGRAGSERRDPRVAVGAAVVARVRRGLTFAASPTRSSRRTPSIGLARPSARPGRPPGRMTPLASRGPQGRRRRCWPMAPHGRTALRPAGARAGGGRGRGGRGR
jgi:hypothetical protein